MTFKYFDRLPIVTVWLEVTWKSYLGLVWDLVAMNPSILVFSGQHSIKEGRENNKQIENKMNAHFSKEGVEF